MKLIDKDTLVAEIERRMEERDNSRDEAMWNNELWSETEYSYRSREDEAIIDLINTFEVKEVDLEKELIEWHKEHFQKDGTFIGMSGFYLTNNSQLELAKHFFELGVNASNPLTWKDIQQLLSIAEKFRTDVYISTKKITYEDFYTEVLKRFKAQKIEKV